MKRGLLSTDPWIHFLNISLNIHVKEDQHNKNDQSHHSNRSHKSEILVKRISRSGDKNE
jgi:hypothetical protein